MQFKMKSAIVLKEKDTETNFKNNDYENQWLADKLIEKLISVRNI